MQPLIIIGASGFIGHSLLMLFGRNINYKIRIISRDVKKFTGIDVDGIEIIQGDLLNKTTLDALIEPGAIVINLAYLDNSDKFTNLNVITNLVDNCKSTGIKRLIHCSTCSVYGNVKNNIVTEEVSCKPKTEYERTKYEIEKLLIKEAINNFELIILRPTSVFGSNGKNLLKCVQSFEYGNPITNYLRACIYSKRRMNIVSVDTVASSIKYLSELKINNQQEVFIISEDDEVKNNYYDIEYMLRKYMHIKHYIIPIIPLPNYFLRLILMLRFRSNSNPYKIYSSNKIRKLGFNPPQSLEQSLKSYVEDYQKNNLNNSSIDI